MTAGTGERRGEEGAGKRIDLLIGDIGDELGGILLGEILRTEGEKTRRDEKPGTLGVVLRRQEITGELFGQETVVGQVAVEGVDDVVPLTPRMRIDQVRLLAVRFREANHIEPVPRPALAVGGAGEEGVCKIADCGLRIADWSI